jgi:hypothetical protein
MSADTDVLQGVPAMARATGLRERLLRYLIEQGLLDGIVKIRGRYFILRGNLLANFRPNGKSEIELRELMDAMSREEVGEVLQFWGYSP